MDRHELNDKRDLAKSAVKVTIPVEPTDKYALVIGNDVAMILADEYELSDLVVREESTFIVYAETIYINKDLHFIQKNGNGKNIGLFCHELVLVSITSARISVNGKNGDNLFPNSSLDPNAGGNAGWLKICIENLQPNLFPRVDNKNVRSGLFLECMGGAGGRGSDTSFVGDDARTGKGGPGGSDGKGGPGGNGGNAGNVEIYYGSFEVERLYTLVTSQSCHGKVDAILALEAKAGIQAADLIRWKTTANMVKDFYTILTSLQTSVDSILVRLNDFVGQPGVHEARSSASDFNRVLATVLREASCVQMDQLRRNILTGLQSQLNEIDSNDYPDEQTWVGVSKTLHEALKNLQLGSRTDGDQTHIVFENTWQEIKDAATGAIMERSLELKKPIRSSGDICARNRINMADFGLGPAGPGGRPSSSDQRIGAAGKAGMQGKITITPLDFQGKASSLDIATVLAQPDHCQMLSNRADLTYLSATNGTRVNGDAMAKAYKMYTVLKKRLAFVDTALKAELEANKNPSTSTKPLVKAYLIMELSQQLTISALSQLQSISSHASRCLRQINQHQDLFGQTANWAPRLSYTYYRSRVDTLIETLKAFEEVLSKTSSKPDLIDKSAMQATRKNADSAQIRIDILTGTNGPLKISAYQIEAFTPIMRTEQAKVRQLIASVQKAIKAKLNIGIDQLLEAFSMIALAPTAFNTAVQLAGTGFKMASTVMSAKGVPVKKDYVIQQFGSCDGKIKSLALSYKTLRNGSIDLDDPGAAKLLVAESDLKALMVEFQSAIPEDIARAVDVAFGKFIATVRKRNDAVLTYNTTLTLLTKAQEDYDYYTTQQLALSDKATQVDPNHPSRRFWIRKTLNDLRHTVYEVLSSGQRALEYWGLPKDDINLRFPAESDLAPSILLLSQYRTTLDTAFESCLKRYAANFASRWPPQKDRIAPGVFARGKMYKLKPAELAALKIRNYTDDSRKQYVHQVTLTIAPVTSRTSSQESNLSNCANVRIDGIRVWLPGAKVAANESGEVRLEIGIDQLGSERIVRWEDDRVFSFVHDPILLGFSYDPTLVLTQRDLSKGHIWDEQAIPAFNGGRITEDVVAPIGPFADWRITVSSLLNEAVDLSGVQDAQIEFWGSSEHFPNVR